MVGLGPSYQGCYSSDVCGVVRKNTRVLRPVIGQNRWISAMLKTKVKLNFKLLSGNVLYDGVIRVEALNSYGLVSLYIDSTRL